MDEQSLTSSVPAPAGHPLLRRLGSFAVTHFVYSILASHCTLLLASLPGLDLLELSPVLSYVVLLAYAAVLILLYLPLGLLVGRNSRSNSITTVDEAVQATALEAGLAWVWAGAVIAGVFSSPEAEPWLGWLAWLAMVSFLLAYPSSILVLMGLALTSTGTMMDLDILPLWIFWAFWAGLLPPLLFNLGCLWTPKKAVPEPTPDASASAVPALELPPSELPTTKEDGGL